MAKIIRLEIKNYCGIEYISLEFKKTGIWFALLVVVTVEKLQYWMQFHQFYLQAGI